MGDLHTKKVSHVSFPITKKLEWHLEKKDVGHAAAGAKKVALVMDAVRTSHDGGHTRYRQTAKVRVVPHGHGLKARHGVDVEHFNKSK